MEKLSEKERARVSKMSDIRIISKLIQSCINVEELEAMDRSALLDAMASLVANGKFGFGKRYDKSVSHRTRSIQYYDLRHRPIPFNCSALEPIAANDECENEAETEIKAYT